MANQRRLRVLAIDDPDPKEMSIVEHLEELRSRLIKALAGLVVAFILCIGFCKDLWSVVSAPSGRQGDDFKSDSGNRLICT